MLRMTNTLPWWSKICPSWVACLLCDFALHSNISWRFLYVVCACSQAYAVFHFAPEPLERSFKLGDSAQRGLQLIAVPTHLYDIGRQHNDGRRRAEARKVAPTPIIKLNRQQMDT